MPLNLSHIYCLLLGLLGGMSAAGTKPNVLFIAIDDLRPELGCYGSPQVKTPHIDRLASQGMRFDRAYCQVPICMGSRASLMTSILPTRKRFDGNCEVSQDTPNAVTLPEAFRKAGYTTISNGKIFHHTDDTAKRSWSEAPWMPAIDHMHSHDPETTRRLSKRKNRGRIFEAPEVADSAYLDGQVAAKTINDLRRLKESGQPFFLASGFIRPHLPFYAPKPYWDLYERDQIQIADNRFRPRKAPKALRSSGEFKSYHLADFQVNSEAWHRMMRHGYYACTSYADKLTGDILKELERLELEEETIVVIWGDHGWHLGEHNFWGKHNTMHLATRVPLIIRVPGSKAGASQSLVEVLDLYPTLGDLAGIELPATVQGRSFSRLLDEPGKPFRNFAYCRFKTADAVITSSHHYTRYHDSEAEMLFDLEQDPAENFNLADDPAQKPVILKMREHLSQRQAEAAKLP